MSSDPEPLAVNESGNAGDDEQPKPDSTEKDEPSADEQPPPIQDIKVVSGQLLKLIVDPSNSASKAKDREHPQIKIKKFWQNFEPDYEGGIDQILPTTLTSDPATYGTTRKVTENFVRARETCIKGVQKIVRECRALNQKYTDIHFDLERDLKLVGALDCLFSLGSDRTSLTLPRDVKRVTEIYEEPQLFKDGAGYDDIMQGQLGDCWLLAGLSTLTANEQLLRDICVIHDVEVDGEWEPCIIDDKLYLRSPAFHESSDDVLNTYGMTQKEQEKTYKKLFQTGSKSLHFAACRDENETWVPLLEKAYAKAHGDFESLEGGWTGEALEDLTGGVTTEIYSNNILSKDRFWNEQLRYIGKKYLFSAGSASYTDWRGATNDDGSYNHAERQKGVIDHHAYAVLDTYDGFGQRLVKMRNPWGHREWEGAWSDGSPEWTATWLQRLDHKFGNDGVFWISYSDMLNRYASMDCTRIFGPEWYVAQQWTKVQVPWSITDYQRTKFTFDLPAPSEVIIVLSQLDDRYFVGLKGQFFYHLHFRLHKDGDDDDDYITRSKFNYELDRSVNVQLELEAGKYTVVFKLEAFKNGMDDAETVLRKEIWRRAKITQTATLYDLAHAKGIPAKPKIEEPAPVETKETVKTENQNSDIKSTAPEDKAKDQPVKPEPEQQKDDPKEPEQKVAEQQEEATATPGEESTSSEDPQRDPWNAYCTVGLRVYSKVPEMQLHIIEAIEEKPAILDRDAIAKSAATSVKADSELKEVKKGSETGEKTDATSTAADANS